ncbi:MAG: hypothetical protein ACK5OX_01930 [Desertimonas sp.]
MPVAGLIAVVAIVGVAFVWLGDSDDDPQEAAGDWPPTDPTHQRSIRIDQPVERPIDVRTTGGADELYVATPNGDETVVRRFDDGEESWEAAVDGEVWTITTEGDLLLVTADIGVTDGTEITMLDTDGELLWSHRDENVAYGDLHEGRTFAISSGAVVIELDSRAGDELDRLAVSAARFDPLEGIVADVSDGEVQRYDLDFEPVGRPIPIEESGVEFTPYVYRVADGVVQYVTGDRLVEVGLDGREHFRCSISVADASSIGQDSEGLIAVRSYEAMSIVEPDGDGCHELWSAEGSFSYMVAGDHVVNQQLDPDTYEVIASELVEVRSGDTVLERDGEIGLVGDAMLVADDGELRRETVPNGRVEWSIDTAEDARWVRLDDAIGIIALDGEMITIDLYAD